MAAAATIGVSRSPNVGYSTPTATVAFGERASAENLRATWETYVVLYALRPDISEAVVDLLRT
jgi:hypothetical protein